MNAREMAYFDRKEEGYSIVFPGVALGGPVTCVFSREDHLWHITQQDDGERVFRGVADTKAGAYLNLIADRLDIRKVVITQ